MDQSGAGRPKGLAILTSELTSVKTAPNPHCPSSDLDFHDAEDSVSAVSDQIPQATILAFRRHARPQSRAKFDDGIPMSQMMPKYIHSGVAESTQANATDVLLPAERQYASPPKTSRGYFTMSDPSRQASDFNKLYHRTRTDRGFTSPGGGDSARAAMLRACISTGVAPEPVGVLRPIEETFDAEGMSMGEYRSGAVAAALKQMPNLETLILRENRLSGRLSARLFEAVEYQHLQYIDIAKNHLHSTAVRLLCVGLAHAPQLGALDLEDCKLSSADAVRLVRSLRRCTQLQRLVLRGNQLQDCVAYELLCLLVGDQAATVKLEFLTAGRSARAAAAGEPLGSVARRSSLTPSTAIGIKSTDDGSERSTLPDSDRWFERLAQNLALLDFAWNDFSPTGCALLFQGLLSTKVAVLEFAGNTIGSAGSIVGVDSLCQWLDMNTSLTHLNLSHCGLSLLHGEMLSQALHGNVTLRGLHLGGNDVTSDARGYACMLHAGAPAQDQRTADAVAAMERRRHLDAADVPSLRDTDCDASSASISESASHTMAESEGTEGDGSSPRMAQPTDLDLTAASALETGPPAPQSTKYLHVSSTGGVSLSAPVREHLAACLEEMGSAWWSNSDVSVSNTHDMRSIVPRKVRGSRRDWSEQAAEADSSLVKALGTMRHLSKREKSTIKALEAQRVGMQESMSSCWLCGRWRPVTFKYAAPISGPIARRFVLLVTSFDDWVPQLLKPSADGSAYHLHRMVPSRPFYFAFIVDGVMRAGMDYNIAKVEQPREKGRSAVAGIARLLDQLKSADEVAQKGFIPPGTEFLNFMPAPGAELAKLAAVTHAKMEAESAQLAAAQREQKEALAFDDALEGRTGMGAASTLTPDSIHIGSTLHRAAKHRTPGRLAGRMSQGSRRRSITMFAENWQRMRQESEQKLGLPQPPPPPASQGVRRTKRLSMLNVARAIAMPIKMAKHASSGVTRVSEDNSTSAAPAASVLSSSPTRDVHFGRRASAPSPAASRTFQSPTRRRSMLPAVQASENGNSVNGALGALTQNHIGATLAKYSGPPVEPRTGGSGDGTTYIPHVDWTLSDGTFAGCKPDSTESIRRCVASDMGYIGSRLAAMLKDEAALAQLQQLFEQHYLLLVSVFKRYCLAGAGRGGAKDFFNVSFGGLRQLAFDTGIRELPGVVGADIDRMFIASDNRLSKEANNPYKALCRHEFLECLVRLAQLGAAQLRSGAQMVSAFEEFVRGPLTQRAMYDRDELQHAFRETQLWTEPADLAVRQYKDQLQNLHELFKCTRIQRIALASNAKALDGIDLMSWLHLLELAGLIDEELLGISEMDARIAFLFAKRIVTDEQSHASTHRVLSQQELYEALGRLALRVQQVPEFDGVPFVAAYVEVLEFATSIVDESSDAYLHPDTIAALRNRTTSLSLHKAGLEASLEQGGDRAEKAARQLAAARSTSAAAAQATETETHTSRPEAESAESSDPQGEQARESGDSLAPVGEGSAQPTGEISQLPSFMPHSTRDKTYASDLAVCRDDSWTQGAAQHDAPPHAAEQTLNDAAEEVEESHGHVQSLASLRSAFHAFDVDGTGYLSMDEITQLLFDVGQSEALAKRMLQTMDANGDGEVSYNEFMAIAAQML